MATPTSRKLDDERSVEFARGLIIELRPFEDVKGNWIGDRGDTRLRFRPNDDIIPASPLLLPR